MNFQPAMHVQLGPIKSATMAQLGLFYKWPDLPERLRAAWANFITYKINPFPVVKLMYILRRKWQRFLQRFLYIWDFDFSLNFWIYVRFYIRNFIFIERILCEDKQQGSCLHMLRKLWPLIKLTHPWLLNWCTFYILNLFKRLERWLFRANFFVRGSEYNLNINI